MASTRGQQWAWLHGAAWVAVVLQPSTPADIMGRYSSTAFALLVALTVTWPLVGWGAPRLIARASRLTVPRPIRATVLLLVMAFVFALWMLPGASATSYAVLRLYLTAIAAAVALWTVRHAESPIPTTRAVLFALAALGLAALFALALRFPGVRWIDEAYMASLSYNVAQTGQLKPLVYEYVDTESYALMYVGLGGWFRAFGFGLWTARAFVYVVGLLTLAITWDTARRIWNPTAATLAALLGAVALLPLNLLRQDVSVALYLAIALWLYHHAQTTQRSAWHIAVGFFVAFATDGHPNAYRFSFAFGAAYLLTWALQIYEARAWRWYPPVFYLAVGGVLGVLAYVGLYVWLTDDFLKLAASPFLDATKPPHLVLLDQFIEPLRSTPHLFGAAIAGLWLGWHGRDRKPMLRLLTVVWVVNMAIIAVLYGYYRTYYVAQSVGLFVLMSAALFAQLRTDAARLTVAALIAVASIGFTVNRWQQPELRHGFNDAIHIAHVAAEDIAPDAVVIAPDPMYFPLYDRAEFVDYATAGWVRNKFGTPDATLWAQIAPDAILWMPANPEPPPTSLWDYITENDYISVRCWQSPHVGRVDLFVQADRPTTDLCEDLP